MFLAEEAVQFPLPVPETGFSPEELRELLSFFESEEPISLNSGSESSSRVVYSPDERKQRRKISNRESARRSRLRKKRHLENLTDQVNRLNVENRQLKNRLSLVINQYHVVWVENEVLRSESEALWAKLMDLYWTSPAMQCSHDNSQHSHQLLTSTKSTN
ncbi:basic leucine zipper 4-like [Hibiscus syriacus]|uniref:basic leucine zipper 4-like n=1 Tax=Hibiscus syriacus TaxID=106335 RepID=UPI001921E3AD|nr:basic leucine zipper 4-like [Hibiscus syriacus]